MAGIIAVDMLGDGSKRYRSRYRDAGGRQHEKRFERRVDAQHWLDEQTLALVMQTWTAPERGRVTVEAWADQWLAAQTGLKPSTLYRRYRSLRGPSSCRTGAGTGSPMSPTPGSPPGWPSSSAAASRGDGAAGAPRARAHPDSRRP
jgi:hypothetical protein